MQSPHTTNWISDKIPATSSLFVMPNFFRELSRLADLFGSLDEYRYSKDADREALHRDYSIAYAEISKAMQEYERKNHISHTTKRRTGNHR